MNFVSAAFATLVDEVTAMVEPLVARKRRRPPVTFVERGGEFEFYRNERRAPVLVARGALSNLQYVKLPKEITAQPVEVRLDGGRVLSKTLQLPAASRGYLDAVVTNQLERMTPWAADRVVFDYKLAEEGASSPDQISVRLVATSRDVFDATMARLSAAGIQPALVGTSEDPLEETSAVNLLHTDRSGRRDKLRRRIATALLAILAIGLIGSGLSSWRLYGVNAEAAEVQDQMDAARRVIEEARSKAEHSEDYARLLASKQKALPMVTLLEELSKVLPASTYLTELGVQRDEVRLAGYSSDAPALIGILDGADHLSDVHFAAATTRGDNDSRDRFEIVAHLQSPDTLAAAAPAPASAPETP